MGGGRGREGERERDRQTDRQTERERERERERDDKGTQTARMASKDTKREEREGGVNGMCSHQ